MHVYLIHGMGRTPLSMWLLDRRLRRLGYTTSRFGYWVTVSGLGRIAARFADLVCRTQADGLATGGPTEYAIIGHSLGNVVTRMASPNLPPGFSRFVMLAPPNRSPRVARSLSRNPLFRVATGDAGAKLADPEFFSALPVPETPSLIIAGNRGPRWGWPFREANDLLLEVADTELPGCPLIEVPGFHTFIMNRYDVLGAIERFLRDPAALPTSSE